MQCNAPKEETKDEAVDTVASLSSQISHYLETVRNDGNKVYFIDSVSTAFGGAALPSEITVASLTDDGGDLFAQVRIEVDTNKTVKPISTGTAAVAAPSSDDFTAGKKPFRTLAKYSYAESGSTLVKVLISDLDKL